MTGWLARMLGHFAAPESPEVERPLESTIPELVRTRGRHERTLDRADIAIARSRLVRISVAMHAADGAAFRRR